MDGKTQFMRSMSSVEGVIVTQQNVECQQVSAMEKRMRPHKRPFDLNWPFLYNCIALTAHTYCNHATLLLRLTNHFNFNLVISLQKWHYCVHTSLNFIIEWIKFNFVAIDTLIGVHFFIDWSNRHFVFFFTVKRQMHVRTRLPIDNIYELIISRALFSYSHSLRWICQC